MSPKANAPSGKLSNTSVESSNSSITGSTLNAAVPGGLELEDLIVLLLGQSQLK